MWECDEAGEVVRVRAAHVLPLKLSEIRVSWQVRTRDGNLVVYSPDRNHVASGWDCLVKIWDVKKKEEPVSSILPDSGCWDDCGVLVRGKGGLTGVHVDGALHLTVHSGCDSSSEDWVPCRCSRLDTPVWAAASAPKETRTLTSSSNRTAKSKVTTRACCRSHFPRTERASSAGRMTTS